MHNITLMDAQQLVQLLTSQLPQRVVAEPNALQDSIDIQLLLEPTFAFFQDIQSFEALERSKLFEADEQVKEFASNWIKEELKVCE